MPGDTVISAGASGFTELLGALIGALVLDGAVVEGAVVVGTVVEGTVVEGAVVDGTVVDGAVVEDAVVETLLVPLVEVAVVVDSVLEVEVAEDVAVEDVSEVVPDSATSSAAWPESVPVPDFAPCGSTVALVVATAVLSGASAVTLACG